MPGIPLIYREIVSASLQAQGLDAICVMVDPIRPLTAVYHATVVSGCPAFTAFLKTYMYAARARFSIAAFFFDFAPVSFPRILRVAETPAALIPSGPPTAMA